MTNRLIPVWLLVVIGTGLIGLILYASPNEPEFDAVSTGKMLAEFTQSSINFSSGNDPDIEYVKQSIPDEIPYFKTFKEEIGWYTQFEPTLMIEEPDCDTLVKKYKGFAEFQDKVNYSFRILEVCDLG